MQHVERAVFKARYIQPHALGKFRRLKQHIWKRLCWHLSVYIAAITWQRTLFHMWSQKYFFGSSTSSKIIWISLQLGCFPILWSKPYCRLRKVSSCQQKNVTESQYTYMHLLWTLTAVDIFYHAHGFYNFHSCGCIIWFHATKIIWKHV